MFEAVCKSYAEKREDAERIAWSRMRLQTCITISPHIRERLSPKELIEFPWEKPEKPTGEIAGKEEAKKRFTRLAGAMKEGEAIKRVL